MSDLTERMLHIRQIPVGAMLPAPVLRVIAEHLHPRTFAKGSLLMRRGEPIDGLHMLTDGGVALTREGTSLGELDAPQTLGFLGILARQDGPYDATAKSEVQAYELETDTLLELLEDHFELLSATLRYLAERIYFDMQELPEESLGLPPTELGPIPKRQLDVVEEDHEVRHPKGTIAHLRLTKRAAGIALFQEIGGGHRSRRCRGPAVAGEHSGAMSHPSRARPCRWHATKCTQEADSGLC